MSYFTHKNVVPYNTVFHVRTFELGLRGIAGMIRRQGGRVAAVAFITVASLEACSTLQGAPQRAIDPNDDLRAIESMMSAVAVSDCLQGVGRELQNTPAPSNAATGLGVKDHLDETRRQACRNRIVTTRKYAIDVRFSQFEQDFFSQNRWAGFAATAAALGLGTAGALSPTGTAQALAAAAAGVAGTRAAYEREVLAERTLLTIDTAMHAQRDLIAINIRDGLKKSTGDYPLGTALSDLDAYYRAGTVLGALTVVNQAVGVQADAAQAELRNPLQVTRTPPGEFLRQLVSTGTEDARSSNEQRIRDEMTKVGVPETITVTRFVFTGDPEKVEAVARDLGWKP